MGGCADHIVCRLDENCDDFANYQIDPTNPSPPLFFVSNIPGFTNISLYGCWSCDQTTGSCPTCCPDTDGCVLPGDDSSGDNGGEVSATEPFSIVAPSCGTIVEVECPLVATMI